MRNLFVRHKWIKLGVLALLVRLLFSCFPEAAEMLYRQGLFRVFRIVWDFTLGFSPLPLVYVLLFCLLIFLWRKWRLSKKAFCWRKLLGRAGNTLGFVVFWFLLLWGYNYDCPGLVDKMQLSADEEISLESASIMAIEAAEGSRQRLGSDFLTKRYSEASIVRLVENKLVKYGFPVEGRVRCRVLHTDGFMRRMGILGIYLPFVGEGHVDGSQLNFSLYFSMAHEMSHGYGITDEGEANLTAWLALVDSEDPALEYFANLEWMRSALGRLRWANPDRYKDLRASLSVEIESDLNLIYENNALYPPLFPDFSEAVNNLYLESQGVDGGVESYGSFVTWVAAIKLGESRNR